jgi:REP element-mobilizing transposase RayT
MPHSFSSLLVHVVFGTKGRARSIDANIRPDLFAYMGGIVREMRGTARLINGTEDHVHMLLSLPADVTVSECLRVVKANSSRWAHERFPGHHGFAWQTGYGAFSVSSSNEKHVIKYIQDQERHHRRMTFEEEFVALLRKHGLAFDERYLWR